jgi:hypothetical protein
MWEQNGSMQTSRIATEHQAHDVFDDPGQSTGGLSLHVLQQWNKQAQPPAHDLTVVKASQRFFDLLCFF